MSVTKKQHYVWRHYLRAWTTDESIWTYFKEVRKIERISLMGVAQERYFYKLQDLSEDEEAFLKEFIEQSSPDVLKGLNYDFVRLFTSTGKLKKQLGQSTNPSINREFIEEEIRKLEVQLMEDAHGRMEGLGMKLLKYRTLDELKTVDQDDYIFDAIMFLCFQYFRTRNMKKAALQSFAGGRHEELANKTWNILSYILATILAKSLSYDPNLKFIFIENTTPNHFITGDQPIFNILNDKVNEKGEVTELEFYYPITPQHALTIHFRPDGSDRFSLCTADEEMAGRLNQKVYDNAEFFVFGDAKDQLNRFL